jgi:hypothetical protein
MTHAYISEFASQDDLGYCPTAEPVHVLFSMVANALMEDSLVVDIKDDVLFDTKLERPLLRKTEAL